MARVFIPITLLHVIFGHFFLSLGVIDRTVPDSPPVDSIISEAPFESVYF